MVKFETQNHQNDPLNEQKYHLLFLHINFCMAPNDLFGEKRLVI